MGYPRKTTPVLTDLALIEDSENSAYRTTPLSAIQTLFTDSDFESLQEPVSQYSAPATGATVAITDENKDSHLILTPVGGIAALTITLPAIIRDKQTVLVTCTQTITTLTIEGNGAAAVNGAPATLVGNEFFTLKYDLAMNSWYRIR